MQKTLVVYWDLVLIPEMSLFPIRSVRAEKPLRWIHFLPALEFLGNLKIVGVRKSAQI
jgi:hypothetical protein